VNADVCKDLPAEHREVDAKAMQAYAQQVKIPFLETSAKANINITEAFHELVRECRRRKQQDAGEEKGKRRKSKKSSCNLF